jgi:hypothetical protein
MWVTSHQPLHGKSAESLPLCCPLQSGKKLNETTGEFRVGENHKKPHDKISGNKKTTTQISRIEPNSILLQTAIQSVSDTYL